MNIGDRQSQYCAGMQGKLRQVLGDHGDHAGIMRAWRYLAEDDIAPLDEQFYPEDTASAKCCRYFPGNIAGTGKSLFTHGLWLPGLAVITVYLHMADGFSEAGPPGMADGELGDFIIKVYKTFNDDLAGTGAAALLCVFPGGINFGVIPDGALPLAG